MSDDFDHDGIKGRFVRGHDGLRLEIATAPSEVTTVVKISLTTLREMAAQAERINLGAVRTEEDRISTLLDRIEAALPAMERATAGLDAELARVERDVRVSAKRLADAEEHLTVVLNQSLSTDDQIIMGHVRVARDLVRDVEVKKTIFREKS